MGAETAPARSAFRPLGIAGAILLMMLGAAGWKLSRRYFDEGEAAGELPQAIVAYRAAGLPWTVADLARDHAIPPEENAAPFLKEVVARFHRESVLDDPGSAARKAADRGDWAAVAAYLRTVEPGLAAAERASERRRSDFGPDPDLGWSAPPIGGSALHDAVGAMLLRARLEAHRGHGEEAVRELGRARAFVRRLLPLGWSLGLSIPVRFERESLYAAVQVAERHPQLAESLRAQIEASHWDPDLRQFLREGAYDCVASFRNGAAEELEAIEREGSLAPELTPPTVIRREGSPPGVRGQAYLCRSLQFWTAAEPEIRRYADDPVRLRKALDRLLERSLERTGRSYRFTDLALRSFAGLDHPILELRADRAVTLATLRAIETRHRTGAWPRVLITGNDPYGHAYVGRREGAGIRILSRGEDGIEGARTMPAAGTISHGSASFDIVSVVRELPASTGAPPRR